MKDHRHPKARDKFDNILLPITICCMHASMPPKRTLRRLRGYLPESQERVKVGSDDASSGDSTHLAPPELTMVCCRGVWQHNLLEAIFLFNLGTLSVTTLYTLIPQSMLPIQSNSGYSHLHWACVSNAVLVSQLVTHQKL